MSERGDQRRIGRFRLLRLLGTGGAAHTWLAEDTTSGEQLAVKELRLVKSSRTKQIELFERECSILKEVRHPQIPHFIDTIVERGDETLSLFLVQEFIKGPSLQQLIDGEHRFSHHEVVAIMKSCLAPLIYLHEREPQLFHRDLKPSNIIVRPSGECVLIDFGAVREAVRDENANGSSIVGTFGYMAPEQFQARAYAATDLYGLAATALHLMTGMEPARFELIRLKPDIHPFLEADPHLTAILDILLEPSPEDRYSSARSLFKALERWEETYGAATFVVPSDDASLAPTRRVERGAFDGSLPTAPMRPMAPGAADATEAAEGSGVHARATVPAEAAPAPESGATRPTTGPTEAVYAPAAVDTDESLEGSEDATESGATIAAPPASDEPEGDAAVAAPADATDVPDRTTARQLKQRITDASKAPMPGRTRIPVQTEHAGAAECLTPGGQGASVMGALVGAIGLLVAAVGVVAPIEYNEAAWMIVGGALTSVGALLALVPRRRPGRAPSEPLATADCVIERIVKRVGPLGLGGIEWNVDYHFVAADDLHYEGRFRLPSAAAAKEVATDPARVAVRYGKADPETSNLAFRKA